MWIGHRKEIQKLTFRALALRRSESNVLQGVLVQNISYEDEFDFYENESGEELIFI